MGKRLPSDDSEALFKMIGGQLMSNAVEHHDIGLKDLVTKKGWFAVFTTSRHEKRVEEHFRVREIESFLPLYRMRRQWKDGSKGIVQFPLFQNYIFVHIERNRRVPVLEVPGVLSIVGDGRESMSVPESYIHCLQEGLQQGKIEPHSYLTNGRRVRIRSGVMAGMEGILLRKKNDFRVVLTLQMIMKSVKVEVALDEIEPADAASDFCLSESVDNA
ncbi:MAG TPA: UpxY family transcription antiterminator [Pyrinomonadaceae bacterium]|nr:UpxY family transcription antiterminator [Pyrinomonadaceae bacterium]